jgi:hypothetical protein
MHSHELDEVVAAEQVLPTALGADAASEPRPRSPPVPVPQPETHFFEWFKFRPGGPLTINDKDADASCLFFWSYVAVFVVGLVCLFVGCGLLLLLFLTFVCLFVGCGLLLLLFFTFVCRAEMGAPCHVMAFSLFAFDFKLFAASFSRPHFLFISGLCPSLPLPPLPGTSIPTWPTLVMAAI